LELDVSLPEKIVIEDFDLCVIFGNIFDNAIEAVQKCPENQRKITLKVFIKNQNFVLSMQNDFIGEIKHKKDKIATSKADSILHGIGLSNVTQVVEKYQGDYEYYPEVQQFCVKIRIPLREEQ
ncbi:MAG: ATP-binding protein, partial [Culicoidibacterales bacterium]